MIKIKIKTRELKTRREWSINPSSKRHKSKRDYDRNTQKSVLKLAVIAIDN